jgi:hypothetical protein
MDGDPRMPCESLVQNSAKKRVVDERNHHQRLE